MTTSDESPKPPDIPKQPEPAKPPAAAAPTGTAELKKEILAEIRKELLKREILKELEEAEKPPPTFFHRPAFKALSSFFQHSAVLLLIGFILTGVIGSALTSAWQNNSWMTQQSLLAKQRILDQKYELASSVAKAIGDTHAAPTSVLLLFTNEDTPQNRQTELPKRVDYWRQTHREWLINNNVLLQKITVYVKNPNARTTFNAIIQERKQTNNSVVNLLLVMEENKGDKFKVSGPLVINPKELEALYRQITAVREGIKEAAGKAQAGGAGKGSRQQVAALREQEAMLKITYYAGNAQFHLNEANDKAKDLMEIMAVEIREDSIPPRPQGFWSVLSQIFGGNPSPLPTPSPSPSPSPSIKIN